MGGDVDFLRDARQVLAESVIDAERPEQIGAQHGESNSGRVTQRNGHRSRDWNIRVTTMELRISKSKEDSYFPSPLELARRTEKAPLTVIQKACVARVSTTRIDDLISEHAISMN